MTINDHLDRAFSEIFALQNDDIPKYLRGNVWHARHDAGLVAAQEELLAARAELAEETTDDN